MNENTDFNQLSLSEEALKPAPSIPMSEEPDAMRATIKQIYEALCEKGYDPARQIAGYILSEDPVFITDWKNARGMIGHINRDDLLIALIRNYLES